MAATGGGKIRSRRYHIASKPYAKSKQQQSGIISRVTDTVKSIVPSWLQKYFKNGDASEEGDVAQGTDQNCLCPPPPNGGEQGPPPLDGRDSPEPSTSNTEPSASRASLNFQDYVLSRPPLSRSHLHFSPLDASSPGLGASSSLFSQPSTSSAPGPFSTGFSLVKEIKDNLSQHEDDNISTTSGFSSRASDKDVPTSKTASLPQLWSPEMDRTNSGPQPSQAGLKKPSFNLSVFGTSSNSTLSSSTLLSSSHLGDSPFYPGKTTYGGAAAVRSSRTRPGTPYQAPVRRQIKAKPAGAQPCGVTSATARRILQSLERMSSPLADAKRIPAASSSFSPSRDSMNLDVSQSKKKRMDSALPPVQKLVVPSVGSFSSNRAVSFRPTLTPGGPGRALDRPPREKTPTRQSPQLPEASPGPSQSTTGFGGSAYPLSSTPAISLSSGGGKIKRERSSMRPSKRAEEDEVAEVPDIPRISLPISTASLPAFSFSPCPPPPASISSPPEITAVTPSREANPRKDPPKASTPPSAPFTFSSPIVKATAHSPPSYSPSTGFTFSAPVAKLGPSLSNGKLSAPTAAPVKPITSKSSEDFEGPFKPAKTLKQGSVLDLLKSPGFSSAPPTAPGPDSAPPALLPPPSLPSPAGGFGGLLKPSSDWSCDVCLVSNKQSDAKCVCCMAPKPGSPPRSLDSKQPPPASKNTPPTSTSASTSGFGAAFSKPEGSWDCDTCLVRNKMDAVKCVACETAKPGTGLKPSLTFPSAFSAVKTVSAPAAPVSTGFAGFGDKFKKPEGAWECETCLVQNKAEDSKCVACMTAKPGAAAEVSSSAPAFGLGDKFKKPEGAWDCDVCLVQNKAADLQCVACQTPKPGASVEPKAFGSSFGSTGTSGSSTFGSSTSGGFKFGTSDSSTSGSGGFKFGASNSESSSSTTSSSLGGFKFGVPSGNASSEPSSKDTTSSSGFKFGGSSEGFKFGTSSDDKKSEQPTDNSGFKFGGSGGIVFGTGSSTSTETNSSKGGFTFGLSKPEEKPSESVSSSSSSVRFNSPSPSQEKTENALSSNEGVSSNPKPNPKGSVFSRLGEPIPSPGTPKEPATPVFSFGKPEEKKKEEKEKVAPPAPSGFLFGGSGKEADAPPPPAFAFGKPAEKSEAPPAAFSFGQSAADSTAAPKPAFSFMANNPVSTPPTSSTSTPTPGLCGPADSSSSTAPPSGGGPPTQAPPTQAPPSSFVFGQPSSSSSDVPAKTFVFGQTQDSQPSAPPTAAPPFIFGASAPPAGAPPASTTTAAPSFAFGATAPPAASSAAPSAAPSPFVFSPAPSGGFQTPSFGSTFGSPFPATASPSPAFGAKPNAAAPVFAQQTNSTPVFGAASSTPGGGFQFGGAGGFGASSPAPSGVFTFGAGSAGPAAPAANAPPAPLPGATGGGFNFSQPPTFNIGSAKSFAASPAGPPQAIAGRKIKTAVRRRK
ncbi:LOW QUALITY PROTEIN: nuclear pore complex protein Nup153 [Menidia menidia]